jgi:hypothetical protein
LTAICKVEGGQKCPLSCINIIAVNIRAEMVNPNRFYTYAYLREDRTPYYIGKGCSKRAFKKNKNHFQPPKDKSRIIFLKQNLTEEEAFKHEIYMIAVFGRIDLGTGILHNRTNGGEGASGKLWTEEDREKKSKEMMGTKNNFYGKTHSEEIKELLSKCRKGKKLSEEGRKHLSNIRKGEKNHFYGKNHSEETKSKISSAKLKYKYQFFSPTNEIFIVSNLKSFCLENNLLSSVMYKIANKKIYNGKRNLTYKGWRVEKLGPLNCISNVITTETTES